MRQKKPPLTGRAALLATMTEVQWRRHVIEWAKCARWRVYSIHDSRQQTWNTDRGFPDLFMARGGHVIAAELKRHRGKPTLDQMQWISDLRWSGLPVYIWRPTDEEEVKRVLGYSVPLAAGRSDAAEDVEGK